MSQTDTLQTQTDDIEDLETLRYRRLPARWMAICLALTTLTILLAVNQVFNLGFFKMTFGMVLVTNRYMYLLAGVMIAMLFLIMPAVKSAPKTRVPWYDALLFVLTLVLTAYFVYFAEDILDEAWEFNPPEHGLYVSLFLWAIVLEAGRRAGGIAVFIIVGVLSLYPVYAGMMPDVISGVSRPFLLTGAFHMFSEESLLGIPMKAFSSLVFGFLLFGVA
ncbi:hypothetical protein [Sneathiella glossodoripedis]|uniref:hypothetical protein n=1 Tax=Sneathiella glossodoripedis TaxID=418853 RepID=UPI0011DD76E3|nr:hypothetical protein [Sneathiella glossodoripedis]